MENLNEEVILIYVEDSEVDDNDENRNRSSNIAFSKHVRHEWGNRMNEHQEHK